ncbi:NAD(P)/FAD-dependent oxidoreductase [Streptomyces rameus]|uniref:NAD(P)/FAD-dependent oxidoreductase n=1 Tax=Streptomyces rameus TaxID=68261 RepID=A0ABP6NIB5_9ACTN
MTVTAEGPLPSAPYDVAIVGAGVVGCAIARELARHPRLRVALVEAQDDVGQGTSKANTAILHTGFDATPGTLEARLVREGYERLGAYAAETGIPVERVGALLVAWDEEQLAALPRLAEKAERNAYRDTVLLGPGELYAREPHLGPGALGALHVPGESIICPWTTTLAYATQAVRAGADLHLNTAVRAVERTADGHRLSTGRGTLRARHLVNAAGLHADTLDRALGHEDFTVTPRRGQLLVHDKFARPLVRHILLPVPTALGKGVLVAPTVYGNVLLGPTAEDLDDRRATGSTADGLAALRDKGGRILPALLDEEVTAVYAGLRAATEHEDYRITAHPEQAYVTVGGIRSTGLTASLAIAAHVTGLLAGTGLDLGPVREPEPLTMPNLGEAFPRPYQRPDLIAADPEYGTLVCHCERVSRGEIRDALAGTIPPRTLEGLRRRTRARAGRCQGFYCGAAVRELFERGLREQVLPQGELPGQVSPERDPSGARRREGPSPEGEQEGSPA